ncbi:MAG: UMP kinase [Puniceicoccales bacterium]|nr:UMP kinase [Puniceicoccales bacterium]
MKYRRAIVKFSGEILRRGDDTISIDIVRALCSEIKDLRDSGISIGIVIGGGNIFRGTGKRICVDYDHISVDYMGMLATVINAIAIADCLRTLSVAAEVFSALPMVSVCETYHVRHAKKSMDDGNVLLLAGGTGNAFFSTDTAAAMRANELRADVIVKGTKVDGVYDKDPKVHGDAKKFSKISFQDVLLRRLNVMDSTAFSLCMDNDMPIVIVDAERNLKSIGRALLGEEIGTTIANH